MGSLQQLIDDLADESVPLSQSLRQLLTLGLPANRGHVVELPSG